MFIGGMPKQLLEQLTRIVDFSGWRNVYVGCSGMFGLERAIKQRHPSAILHGNDVSLLTCAIGTLATGGNFEIAFKDRLAFVEELVDQGDFAGRVAAVMVALEMAKYKGDNDWAKAHFGHYAQHFTHFQGNAEEKLLTFINDLKIASFLPGDFKSQAVRAAEAGGGIVSYPPTYKGGYERIYRFLGENTDWPAPGYGVWDPRKFEEWVDELDAMGVRYVVGIDRRLEGREPVAAFESASLKPLFAYANCAGGTSLRRQVNKIEVFGYRKIDPALLSAETSVQIVQATAGQMNYLKDQYLAKGIAHVPGMFNFLVYLDDMLAGGIILTRSKMGGREDLYLLSDFALVRERRISKLIALLATSRTLTDAAGSNRPSSSPRVRTARRSWRPGSASICSWPTASRVRRSPPRRSTRRHCGDGAATAVSTWRGSTICRR